MKKKKAAALLLAAAMTVGALPGWAVPTVQAAEVSAGDLTDTDTEAPAAWGALPNANQYKYQKDELAAFCHFGMNTYTGSEWGNGKENPSQFALKNDFDDNWKAELENFKDEVIKEAPKEATRKSSQRVLEVLTKNIDP